MKNLQSISKKRKQQQKKLPLVPQPQDQQHNFIYEDMEQANDNQTPSASGNLGQISRSSASPTQEQILFYSQILGIKLPEEEDLLYIAKQCLQAGLPPNWVAETDEQGEIIYKNMRTGEIKFDHPSDQIYKDKVIRQRKNKVKHIVKSNRGKSKTSFVQNIFMPKQQPKQQNKKDIQPINTKKATNLNNLINTQKLKFSSNQDIEQDDEPVHAIKSHKKKIEAIYQNPSSLPEQMRPKQKKQLRIDISQIEKNKVQVNIMDKIKEENADLNSKWMVEQKRKIQQKINLRYKMLKKEAQEKCMQEIRQMKQKQDNLRNMNGEQLKKLIGQQKIQRRKKQLQSKLMLQHVLKIDRKRAEAQKQHRKDLLLLSSQYNIQNLFSQMAQFRKFMNQQKNYQQNNGYLEEMDRNMRVVSKIENDKLLNQMQSQGRQIMYSVLKQMMAQNGDQSKLQQIFEQKLQQLISKYSSGQQDSKKVVQLSKQKQNWQKQKQKQKQKFQKEMDKKQKLVMSQSQNLFGELEMLKVKLREIQEDNNTQRSNLSDKQNKLVDILQNRAGGSARSHNS